MPVVELGYLPGKKSIQILLVIGRPTQGHLWASKSFLRKFFWVGIQYVVGVGELGCFIFSQSPTFLFSFPHSPTQPHYHLFSCFSLPPSCMPLSPLPFLSPSRGAHSPCQHVAGLAFSHIRESSIIEEEKKHIEQRLASWAVQIKKINYKDETVFFHFLLTA